MLGVVVSRADPASVAIGQALLDLAAFDRVPDTDRSDAAGGGTVYRTEGLELREFDRLHIEMERPAEAFGDLDLLVFASKHAGETGELLTAHHTGNFGPADHGGDPNALARACPNAHASVLESLAEYAPPAYEVGMECTHHGPTDVGAPSMFVEVGSAKAQWTDAEAARAVARALLDLRGVDPDRPAPTRRHLVGLGGGHYAMRFERIVRETDWALGHVAADWGLDALGDLDTPQARAVLERAFEASRADYAVIDGERPGLAAAVDAAGGEVVTETWVRETSGVPLSTVRRVEAVCSVEEGLRFGDEAAGYDGDCEVAAVPTELLEATQGIDREATRTAVERATVAFGTEHGGSRVTGPIVLSETGGRERVIQCLLDVLREGYDSVERDGDEVLARQTTFDPDRARTLGVPEGPKFGRLADGETVEVDGEEIPPAVVHTEETRRFSLDV